MENKDLRSQADTANGNEKEASDEHGRPQPKEETFRVTFLNNKTFKTFLSP